MEPKKDLARVNSVYALPELTKERLWRTIKYEEVYLADYGTPREARAGLSSYLRFYNEQRPHQALGNLTPAAVHAKPDRLKT